MRPLPMLSAVTALALAACTTDLAPEDVARTAGHAPLAAPSHQKAKLLRTSERIPNQYVVVLREDTPDVAAAARAQAKAAGAQVGRLYTHALRGYVLRGSEAAAQRLLDDPRVKYVEEDGVVHLDAIQPGATWGIDRIDQRFMPLDGNYVYNATGAGVNAYIIDTGIRITHAEIGGRAAVGFDAVGDGQNGNDCHGHGTHVSGTVGGATYGVAKQVNLFAVRVLDCGGSGTFSGVIAGIDWVTANRVLPAVANMSLGGGAYQAVDDAVTNSVASGVVYAIAAGNSTSDACNFSPARTPAALTVGATDGTDSRAYYSNYGTCLDIFAPGSGVTSAWNTSDTATNTISGTSMATPHVTGAAALYLGANPAATPADVAAALTANATPDAVLNPGLGSPNLMLFSAFINGGGGGGDTTPPTVALTAPADGSTVQGSVTITADASDDTAVSLVAFYVDGALLGSSNAGPYQKVWDASMVSNGAHTLGVRAYDASGNASPTATVTVTVNNPGLAAYDPILRAPKCDVTGPACDTSTLVNGRALLGPELHAPNAINDSCADGSLGSYHSDESLDRIRVHTLDGSDMAPGKTVQIDVTAWAWSSGASDALDLYYAADANTPAWTYLTTIVPPGGGQRVMSAQYTLPEGPLQAVRGNFRFLGSPGPCTTGTYDDRDDLVFAVGPPVPGPHVAFSAACTGLTCTFTDASTDNGGTITGWSWSFGDGSNASSQNASHTFAAPGTYTVSLAASDDQGLSATRSSSVTVTARPPVASFTFSCAGPSCSFTDGSASADGAITAWSWSFGDGSGSSAQSPSHAYAATGSYIATLVVTDSFGQTATRSQGLAVTIPPPVASFSVSCPTPLSCAFTDTSTTQYGTITSWSWSFGDGSGSSAQNPSHAFTYGGSYTATLTVTNSSGLSATTSGTYTVNPPVITLSAVGSRIKGQRTVDLSWSGAISATVVVYRGNTLILTTANDGAERTTVSSNGTYWYRVCQPGNYYCSDPASVTF